MRVLKYLLVFILLLVALVVALVLTFDPNKLKPQIIEAAADNNVLLTIDGDLGWQLWPRIAIKAEKVAVSAPEAPDTPIAAIERFAVAVQLMPLFSQQVKIDGITLTGATIDLKVDKQGRGNWQSLGRVAAVDAGPRPAVMRSDDVADLQSVNATSAAPAVDLQLSRLTLQDSQLKYTSAEGLQLTLSALSAELTDLKLDGSAIPVSLSTQFKLVRPESPTLQGDTTATLTLRVPASEDKVVVERLTAPVTLIQGGTQATAELSANATLLLGRATGDALRYEGDLALAPTNLQKLMIALGSPLPPMARADALHQVSFNSPFKGDDKQLMLEPLTLVLDDSNIRGKAGITDLSSTALLVDIQGDSINLDHYLPPPEADAGAGSQGKKTGKRAAAAPDALPLEALRALNLELLAGFNQMLAKGLAFDQVKAKVLAKDGLVQLKSFDARLHEGPLNANAVFDARKDVATLTFKATGSKMPLEKLLADFDVAPLVSGQGGVVVEGRARGATSTALTDDLTADIALESQQMLLHNMNLEKSLCELAMLAERKEAPAINWTDFTKLQTLTSKMQFGNQKLTIQSMNGGVESMLMAGLGVVDLGKGGLDLKFDLTIDEAANALLNCPLANKKLLNRKLPIRCKDSFAKLGVRSCVPDMAAVEDMYRDQVKEKIGKELDKKLDKNPELKDALKNLLGGKKKQ